MTDEAPRALHVRRAELADRRGDRADAAAWRASAERCPVPNAADHYLLARERADAGEYVRAIEHLREAVRLEPRHFAAWYLLGNCCLDGGAGPGLNDAEAVRCYTVCIALRAGFHGSYYNRGLAYLRTRQHALAEADFSQALALRPRLAEAYAHRGLAREGLGKPREALADLDQALAGEGAPTRAYFARARVRRLLGDAAGAERDEQAGLRRTPRDEEGYIARGARRAASDPTGALEDFREAVRLNPRSLAGLYNQAFILGERLGRAEDAVRVLDELARRYPDLASARASRGVLRARFGQREAAHQDGFDALRLGGHGGQFLYQAACIHAQTSRSHAEDRDEAFRLLGQALGVGFGHDRMETDPDLAPLRPDPRFRQLLRAVRALKGCPSPKR